MLLMLFSLLIQEVKANPVDPYLAVGCPKINGFRIDEPWCNPAGGYAPGNNAVPIEIAAGEAPKGHHIPGYQGAPGVSSVAVQGAIDGARQIFGGGVPPAKNFDHLREAGKSYDNAVKDIKSRTKALATSKTSAAFSTDSLLQSLLSEVESSDIIDLDNIPDPSDSALPFQLQSSGEIRTKLYNTLKNLTKINPAYEIRRNAKDLGIQAVREADISAVNGNNEDAAYYADLAEGFLDIAVGLDPITGTARSAYELITGKNLITGSKLSTLERSFAFVGVATFGYGTTALKAATRFSRIMHGAALIIKDRKELEAAIAAGTGLVGKVERSLSGFGKSFKIIEIVPASVMNNPNDKPAFKLGSHVINFLTTRETRFVRVFTEGTTRPEGRWVVKFNEIKGLTPAQIRDKLNLPFLPTHIVDVVVAPKTPMSRGITHFNQWDQEINKVEGQVQYLIRSNDTLGHVYKNIRKIGE